MHENSPILTPQKRRWRFWLGIFLSLGTILWLIITTDWSDTFTAFSQTNYGLVLLAIGLSWITILMRTSRWRLFFPEPKTPRFGRLTAVLLIGQAVNVVAPARAGDLVKATLVGTKTTTYVLGTLVIQTTLDLLMLVGLVVLLLLQVSLPPWWRGSGEALLLTSAFILLAVGVLIAGRDKFVRLLAILGERWPRLGERRLSNMITEFFHSFDALNPHRLLSALTWSVAIWLVYGLINYILMAAVHLTPSWLISFFLLAVLQLGIAVPSSPGRVGVYHYLSVQSLAIMGVEGATAVSFAIILHFVSVILPIILGGLIIWQMDVQIGGHRSVHKTNREMRQS